MRPWLKRKCKHRIWDQPIRKCTVCVSDDLCIVIYFNYSFCKLHYASRCQQVTVFMSESLILPQWFIWDTAIQKRKLSLYNWVIELIEIIYWTNRSTDSVKNFFRLALALFKNTSIYKPIMFPAIVILWLCMVKR